MTPARRPQPSPALAVLCIAVLAVACGESAGGSDATTATDTAAAEAAAADAPAAADTAKDTATSGATDAGTATDNAAKPDLDLDLECKEIQGCLAKCPADKDVVACIDGCAKDGTAATKTKAKAISDCATQQCKGVAPGPATFGCLAAKCFDPLAACGEWNGTGTCAQSIGCTARCAFGDDACRSACLPATAKAEASKMGALMTCGAEKCYALGSADEIAACIADKCATELGACKADGWNCTQLAACHAKCPPPTPDKPNACKQLCTVLATKDGKEKEAALVECKAGCSATLNKIECINKTCDEKRIACFVNDGADDCNAIFKCVNASCQGIGGDAKCIGDCLKKGSAKAKDGWVYYEGCITLTLETDQAKKSQCAFPYDLTTCINHMNGFCNAQHSACFKPQ
ncbi:MAG: hypothetical protein FJ100_03980 [Deltaproteobacteria bacterium]|nr:hypothetical protein [Deltaproteobacteria bacterium]